MAECGTNVGNNMIAYPCTLDSGHEGPHRAFENQPSVRDRELWETDRPRWEQVREEKRIRSLGPEEQQAERERKHRESGLGEFQGRAQTTAERYTENPTPHPDVTPDTPSFPEIVVDPSIPENEVHLRHPDGREDVFVLIESDDGTSTLRPATEAEKRVAFTLNEGGIPVPNPLAEPTKQREGDQRLPTVNDQPFIQDFVIADIEERKRIGIQRYGTPLQAFNGRNGFLDLYEELVDGAMYARQMMVERRTMAFKLASLVDAIQWDHYDDGLLQELESVIDWLGGGQG